ncbi:LOW QUALITY PROTEIN: feather keratin Cos1-1/Cos1-3/Cos2-1-like [Geothlypis trichas]
MSLLGNVTSAKAAPGPAAVKGRYKRQPKSLLSHPLLLLPSAWEPGHLQPQDMSCNTQCRPCQPCGPTPLANSCNEPCVRQCQNSTVVIEPPAVVVTLPGPILSSFPQNTVVGSSTSAAVGNILSSDGVPINSGGFDISCITRRYGGNRCRPC